MANIILITGFLGAGKTTFMNSLIQAYEDKKIGLIVNEFGEVNIDGMTLRKEGILMEELSNGSIFCACIKSNFLNSLILLSEKDLEYVFIEASGLADPSSMPQILESIRPKTKSPYHYLGSVCIVDGESFLDLYDILPAFERQVQYSNGIIINKADLAGPSLIEETIDKIRSINERANITVTSYCDVDIFGLVGAIEEPERAGVESTNTVESRPKSFILRPTGPLPHSRAEEFLKEIGGSTFRIKGFIETEMGFYRVNGVGKRIRLEKVEEKPEEEILVVISSVGIRMMSILTTAIDKHLKTQLTIN
jgi:G3E family GTPase